MTPVEPAVGKVVVVVDGVVVVVVEGLVVVVAAVVTGGLVVVAAAVVTRGLVVVVVAAALTVRVAAAPIAQPAEFVKTAWNSYPF
jgi:hypothetical protein